MNYFGLALLVALPSDAGHYPDAGAPLSAPLPASPDGGAERDHVSFVEGGYSLRVSGHDYLYKGPTFEALIAPDGTVSFKDKHASLGFVPFGWLAIPRAQREPRMLERTPGEPSVQGSPWLPPSERAHPPRRTPDQRELCPPSSSCWTPLPMTGSIVAGTAGGDVTDQLMQGLGDDPYGREKAKFLSSTFAFRMKLALDAYKEQLSETLDFFPQRLEALWADTRYSPRERRRIIYELWSQTDSTPVGKRVAQMIDLFVRRRLSCGTPDGFTRSELKALRALQPQRVFAPGACGSRPNKPDAR